jgi:PAS domain S-box-containing protein
MSPLSATFTERVLSKLGKLDRTRIERFVRNLARERNFYEGIFEALEEGVIVTDPEGDVLMFNRKAHELLGISRRAKATGRHLLDLIRDEGLSELRGGWRGEKIEQREISLVKPVQRDLLLTLLAVSENDSEEPVARVLILTDVTEHRRREREQARAERLSSLAVLTAGVAHEIKNPLNSMRIHGQLLRQALEEAEWPEEIQAERSRRSTEIILEETQRLTRIVEQFMHAVRPSAPTMRRHNLNDILRRVLFTLSPVEEDPELEIELDLDASLPEVWVDEQQMAQVFVNLMRNALESLDKPARRLRLATRSREGAVEVTVADNGCGIAREDLERIYQPYFTTKFNGTGLGLMVVHRIVGEHGGRIVFQSREGEGTEVSVLLPAAGGPQRLLPPGESGREN